MATETFGDGDIILTLTPRIDRWAIAQVGDEIDGFLARWNRAILRMSRTQPQPVLSLFDPHQHMLACNLMTVRPLPGESA